LLLAACYVIAKTDQRRTTKTDILIYIYARQPACVRPFSLPLHLVITAFRKLSALPRALSVPVFSLSVKALASESAIRGSRCTFCVCVLLLGVARHCSWRAAVTVTRSVLARPQDDTHHDNLYQKEVCNSNSKRRPRHATIAASALAPHQLSVGSQVRLFRLCLTYACVTCAHTASSRRHGVMGCVCHTWPLALMHALPHCAMARWSAKCPISSFLAAPATTNTLEVCCDPFRARRGPPEWACGRQNQAALRTMAMPWPPPMHAAPTAVLISLLAMACARCAVIRAPEAPRG